MLEKILYFELSKKGEGGLKKNQSKLSFGIFGASILNFKSINLAAPLFLNYK